MNTSIESTLPNPGPSPLAHIALFSRLDQFQQEHLTARMQVQHVGPNEAVFWRGDPGGSLYIVNKGRVSVTVPSDKGEHVVLDELGPGGFFGEISLLDGGTRTATIRTLEPTELYMLSREDFHDVIRREPEVAIDVLTVMGQRQRASTEAIRGIKNPNIEFEASRVTLWQKTSDIIAAVAASKQFTLFHLTWFGGWIGLNVLGVIGLLPSFMAFDPYPFGLLTMVVSLEAIFLSIFVMVSQNRQGEKDRIRVDLDYQVNVKAQSQIAAIGEQLDRIEASLGNRPTPPPA